MYCIDTLHRRVSFRAALSHVVTHSVYTTLVFDHVYENVGSAYSNTSGIFRAPFEGTYIFTAYCHGHRNSSLHLKLQHNDDTIGYSYNPSDGSGWHVAVVTTGVFLMPNDSMSVQTGGRAYGDEAFSLAGSMFSGILV